MESWIIGIQKHYHWSELDKRRSLLLKGWSTQLSLERTKVNWKQIIEIMFFILCLYCEIGTAKKVLILSDSLLTFSLTCPLFQLVVVFHGFSKLKHKLFLELDFVAIFKETELRKQVKKKKIDLVSLLCFLLDHSSFLIN